MLTEEEIKDIRFHLNQLTTILDASVEGLAYALVNGTYLTADEADKIIDGD